MPEVVRPHEATDPVAACRYARAAGLNLALATSGTTGAAREIVRTTDSWWDSFAHYTRLARIDRGARLWVPGPAHATMNLFALVHADDLGVAVVGHPQEATHACLTPAHLDRAMPRLPAGCIVVTAGAALPPAVTARAAGQGIQIEHYYGAAELSFVAWAGDAGLEPFPGVEVQVRPSAAGPQLWVRSPYLSTGYHGASGPMHRDADGWATVGDLGSVEGERIQVLGRAGAINTAGATVSIAELESVLRAHAGGALAVHGELHDTLGEVIAVTLEDPSDRLVLQRFARANLPASQRPRRWHVVANLPLTPAGKIDRVALEGGRR